MCVCVCSRWASSFMRTHVFCQCQRFYEVTLGFSFSIVFPQGVSLTDIKNLSEITRAEGKRSSGVVL